MEAIDTVDCHLRTQKIMKNCHFMIMEFKVAFVSSSSLQALKAKSCCYY